MADQSWVIATAVGTGERGFAGDGGPAARAVLNGPFDIGFDPGGNLYFSDTFNHRIRRVDARTGVITTVAGSGEAGYSGDGGPATAARLNEPYGIAVDRAGNVYAADRHNHCVRRIDAASGAITTLAGNGASGFGGDGGPAARAGMVEPNGLALDPANSRLLIADVADNRVRVVDLATGIISTFAGTGAAEHRGDGGRAAAAGVHGARAVKVAPDGTVYILERQGSTLRAVDPRTGVITTVAGTGARGYSGDGGPARERGFRRAQGIRPRPRRRHPDRRHREPCDPPHLPSKRRGRDHCRRPQGRRGRRRPGPRRRPRPAARRRNRPRWRDLYRRHRKPPHPQARAEHERRLSRRMRNCCEEPERPDRRRARFDLADRRYASRCGRLTKRAAKSGRPIPFPMRAETSAGASAAARPRARSGQSPAE